MTTDLHTKVVLITGSSRGIGAATAKLAAAAGAKVILHGKKESQELRTLADTLNATYITCDVTNKEDVLMSVQKIMKIYSTIDVLVNAAGIVRPKPFLELNGDDFYEEFNVNVLGTIYFCQAVIPVMQKAKSGRIVNVSSVRGITELASGRGTLYSMTKASIVNLTAALAKEFSPYIAVNAVAPGFTETDMAKSWNDAVRLQAASNLVGRPALPTEIAEVILFLASQKSSFINGQTILADGGYSMTGK